jgi:hypothetical protein
VWDHLPQVRRQNVLAVLCLGSSPPMPACMQAERCLSNYTCQACRGILSEPVCTPCGHFFCKLCLLTKYDCAVATSTARTFRARKQLKPCPKCNADLHDFVLSFQVNLAMAEEISQYRAKLVDVSGKLKAERARLEAEKPVYEEVLDESQWPTSAQAAQGWRVEVWWPEEATSYGGVVAVAGEGDVVTVHYDDGDVQEHKLCEERVKWFCEVAKAAAGSTAADDMADAAEVGPPATRHLCSRAPWVAVVSSRCDLLGALLCTATQQISRAVVKLPRTVPLLATSPPAAVSWPAALACQPTCQQALAGSQGCKLRTSTPPVTVLS